MVSLSSLRAFALFLFCCGGFPPLRNHLPVMCVLRGALHCALSLYLYLARSIPRIEGERDRERGSCHIYEIGPSSCPAIN